jgi:hypothetical protein
VHCSPSGWSWTASGIRREVISAAGRRGPESTGLFANGVWALDCDGSRDMLLSVRAAAVFFFGRSEACFGVGFIFAFSAFGARGLGAAVGLGSPSLWAVAGLASTGATCRNQP